MKVLVFGCNGQLGQSLSGTVPEGTDLIGLCWADADITDSSSVRDRLQAINPDLVINAAAYTAVDKAEDEPEVARAVNVEGPRNIATAANEIGARLKHISTDFVFYGDSSTPFTGKNVEKNGCASRDRRHIVQVGCKRSQFPVVRRLVVISAAI